MVAHGGASAAAATVAEQCHIRARLKIVNLPVSREEAELDEVISTATRAKLRPCPVLVLLSDGTDRPIGIQHLVLAAISKRRAHAEARLGLDRARQAVLVPFQIAHRNI